ncbi:MAG: YIP1 family protein, partial [Acidobacteriota bacterium]
GVLYAVYLTYLGLPVLMRCPAAKAAGYAIVTVLWAIATWALVAALAMCGTAGVGRMALDVARRSGI